jgi:predicted transcriptional regulator
MTTITIRKKLHQFIDNIEEKKAKAIYTLFEEEIKQGDRISIEQYNKEIDEAEAEFEKGDHITHEEMVKKVKQW